MTYLTHCTRPGDPGRGPARRLQPAAPEATRLGVPAADRGSRRGLLAYTEDYDEYDDDNYGYDDYDDYDGYDDDNYGY